MLTQTLLFLALALALAGLFAAHRGPVAANPPTWLGALAAVVGVLSYRGVFEDAGSVPPPIAFALLGGIGWMLAALRLGQLRPGVAGVRALLAVSLARLPVEEMLHRLFEEGLVPQAMTWAGTNFDIASGLGAAALLALSFARPIPPLALQIWNVAGLALLLNVVVTALLSAPTPLQQLHVEDPNLAVLRYPYTLLVAAVVPAVLYTHLRLFGLGRHEAGHTSQ